MTKNPRPASSEDIPRAVEVLIGLVLRGICLLLAGGLALLGLIAWFREWTWWKAPLLLSAVLALCTFAFRSRGRIVVDEVGPSIIVPRAPKAE